MLASVGRYRQARAAIKKACVKHPFYMQREEVGECVEESEDLEKFGSEREFFPHAGTLRRFRKRQSLGKLRTSLLQGLAQHNSK